MNESPEGSCARVDDWSLVRATGTDAAKFLQGFCTNEVERLRVGESCEAFFTDVKARILAYGWIINHEKVLDVLLSSPRAEKLLEHLDRYLIREQVELSVVEVSCFISDVGSGSLGSDVSDGGAAKIGESMEVRYSFGGASKLTDISQGQRVLEQDQWDWLRISSGLPLDGVDVDERNLPQEVDRNAMAISFTKGCYLGQEPVARIDALGRVNWLLRGLQIESAEKPKPEEDVFADDKQVGRVTSAAVKDGCVRALAYLRREHAEEGAEVTVSGRPAVVRCLPFTD